MKSKQYNLPKITLVLLTYNGGDGVDRILKSVQKLTYPRDKLEILVSDNNSTDDSVDRAKKHVDKVYVSKLNVYAHRAEAMRKATGDFIYMILEQDMEIRSKDFLERMIVPLLKDDSIAGAFTREYPNKRMSAITRFLSYNPSECDPLFEFLTPSIESTIIEDMKDYYLCQYEQDRIPPTTHMLYRRKFLEKASIWNQKYDFDHDTLVKLIKAGFSNYAYVPKAGIYHYHAANLKELIAKRLRNLENHYFVKNENILYRWIDYSNKKQVLKMLFWVVYANMLLPAAIRGLYRSVKFRDWVHILEPIVVFATTDAILYKFLTNKTGRKLIFQSFRTIMGRQ